MRKDSYGRVLKTIDEKKEDADAPKTDSYGKVLKSIPGKKDPDSKKDVKMIAAADDRKKNEDDEKFVKHESFDAHVTK